MAPPPWKKVLARSGAAALLFVLLTMGWSALAGAALADSLKTGALFFLAMAAAERWLFPRLNV
jgi:hypothetical protein